MVITNKGNDLLVDDLFQSLFSPAWLPGTNVRVHIPSEFDQQHHSIILLIATLVTSWIIADGKATRGRWFPVSPKLLTAQTDPGTPIPAQPGPSPAQPVWLLSRRILSARVKKHRETRTEQFALETLPKEPAANRDNNLLYKR